MAIDTKRYAQCALWPRAVSWGRSQIMDAMALGAFVYFCPPSLGAASDEAAASLGGITFPLRAF